MAAKSKVAQQDPRIREAVDEAIRDGRASTDEIVLLIKSMGGDVSRSSVGRYMKNATSQMQRYRDAQEMSKVWVGKLKTDPQGDVGQLLVEMLKTVAFQSLANLNEDDAKAPTAMELMLLAKSLDHMSSAQKRDLDRFVKAREKLGLFFDKLEKEASAGDAKKAKRGIDLETLRMIREEVYGIVG